MKRILLKTQEEIAEFFKEIGVDYATGFKAHCGKEVFSHSADKDMSRVKKYKVKDDDRIVEGYATTPHVDWVKDSVTMEAIKKAKRHLLQSGTNTVFFNHDQNMPVGKVVAAVVNKTGLFITTLISKAKDVEDIWTKIKEGIIANFSIRFLAKAVEVIRNNTGDVLRWDIKEMQILEVSLAPLPMNSTANITNVIGKSMKDLGKSNSKQVKPSNNGSRKMKKVNSDSKAGAISEMVKEIVGEILDDKLKTHLESVKSLLPKTKADVEAEAKAKADEDAKKAKGDAEKAAKDKDDEIVKLKKENEELKKGTPKGQQTGDEPPKGTGELKKALKDIEDEDTCVFVLKAMESEDIYAGLTASEKDKVKQFYFQMLKSEKKV